MGTRELALAVGEALRTLPPVKEFEAQPLTEEELREKLITNRDFEVTVEEGIYFVEAPWLWDVLRNVNMDSYDSLLYFQKVLKDTGVIEKLEQMGINEGDTVSIFGFEFDYVK